jgi:thiazole synthase
VQDRAAYDVIVIGDGIIGLSTALRVAEAGLRCVVLGRSQIGTASLASAGLLAPAADTLAPAVRELFLASLHAYDGFVRQLREFDPALTITKGLIERTAAGDVLHPDDGSVDPVRLVHALRAALDRRGDVRILNDAASCLSFSNASGTVRTVSGIELRASDVVLAAGAWCAAIEGLPRPLPVTPLKGQMIAFGAAVIDRPIMADGIYLVPRDAETLAGATAEYAGFDAHTDERATRDLTARAIAAAPGLRGTPVVRAWTGFRPATPDFLPIIGRDPGTPQLLYACGHSKNGILLAPATATAIAALATDRQPPFALAAFSVDRPSLSPVH